ncbi:hypothetical protein B1H20_23755 [Streptomyces violaceoruber]|uniref:Uncharacterized protein n=1 Tax=Streptomyces violaceoruber TaxID=1935 RepID=A0A1V0UG05_STRVN|nr:hypothetical protein B1H20_23755 [Streptomyces violaceoruber]
MGCLPGGRRCGGVRGREAVPRAGRAGRRGREAAPGAADAADVRGGASGRPAPPGRPGAGGGGRGRPRPAAPPPAWRTGPRGSSLHRRPAGSPAREAPRRCRSSCRSLACHPSSRRCGRL